MKTKIAFLLFLFSVFVQDTFGISGEAGSNGEWSNSATWLFGAEQRVPAEGDTVTIPLGLTVTVSNTVSYNVAGEAMGIIVYGTLKFQTGKKLLLPCFSYINVMVGGRMEPGSGGGNSNYVDICGVNEWSADDSVVVGPASFGNSTFPVVLMDFNGKYAAGKVMLDWTTATEVNNDYFFVQRSVDNLNYKNIAKVAGHGNSSQNISYASVDYYPLQGVNYYRLCQVDYNGERTYSYPVAVRTKEKETVVIYPNPATLESLSLLFSGDNSMDGYLDISDISGKTVYNKQLITFHPGITKLFPGDNLVLSRGIYFVSVMVDEKTFYQKIVID